MDQYKRITFAVNVPLMLLLQKIIVLLTLLVQKIVCILIHLLHLLYWHTLSQNAGKFYFKLHLGTEKELYMMFLALIHNQEVSIN